MKEPIIQSRVYFPETMSELRRRFIRMTLLPDEKMLTTAGYVPPPSYENLMGDSAVESAMASQINDTASPLFGIWHDAIEKQFETSTPNPSRGVMRLFLYAKAFANPASRYYQSAELMARLEMAWHALRERVCLRNRPPRSQDWIFWEINIPRYLADALLCSGEQMPEALATAMTEVLEELVLAAHYNDTGANLIWAAFNLLRLALVKLDSALLENAKALLERAYVPLEQSAVRRDSSYVSHGNGIEMQYGQAMLFGVSQYIYMADGLGCQLSPEVIRRHVDWLLEFSRWIVYGTSIDPFLMGRSVSRGNGFNSSLFVAAAAALLAAVDVPRVDQIRAFAKRALADALGLTGPLDLAQALSQDSVSPLALRAGPPLVATLHSIVSNFLADVPPEAPLIGGRYYPLTDYLLYRQEDYFSSIKASTAKCIAWESINGDNLRGWHTSDGQLILMQSGREYDHNAMPLLDWERLMGITRADGFRIEMSPPQHEPYYWNDHESPWADAAVSEDGLLACRGYDFRITKEQTRLSARKSWFFAPGIILALGSDIACGSTTAEVETVLYQSVKPEPEPEIDETHETHRVVCDGWVLLLPKGEIIKRSIKRVTGNWGAITNTPTDPEPVEGTRSLVLKSHGVNPQAGSYQVVYVPKHRNSLWRDWERAPVFEVLRCDHWAHIVRHIPSGKVLRIVWRDRAAIETGAVR